MEHTTLEENDRFEESGALIRHLFDMASDSLMLVEPGGRILAVNQTACASLGYDREELLRLHAREIGIGFDFERPMEAWDRLNGGISVVSENRYRRKDGLTYPVEEKILAFRYEGRSILSVSARNVTRRQRTETALRTALRRWQATFNAINDAVFILDRDYRILQCNDATGRLLGMPVGEIVGRRCHELVHGGEEPFALCPVARAYHSCGREVEEVRVGDRWFHVTADPLLDDDGAFVGAVHLLSDITLHKAGEETLRQTHRALRILSQCNAAVVRAVEEQALLEDVCRIVVGPAGYSLVSVGYAERDESRSVRFVAYEGPGRGFLDRIRVSWGENEYGRGAMGSSIRTGKPFVARDVSNNPDFAPWHGFLRERGISTVISLPLKAGEEVFGALAIYTAEPGAFDSAEVDLLEELGNNLAHGIMVIRTRSERIEALRALGQAHAELEDRVIERTAQLRQEVQDRRAAEELLRRSEQRYRELVENANSIILKLDTVGGITFFNEFAQRFFGYSEEEILGRNLVGTIVPEMESSGRDLARMVRELTSHPEDYERNENENMRRSGERVWIAWTNRPIRDGEGRLIGTLSVGNDITELKHAEEQLQVFRRFAENAGQGFGIAELDGRVTYMNPALLKMAGARGHSAKTSALLFEIFVPEDRKRLLEEVVPELFRQGHWTGDLTLVAAGGLRVPALVNFFVIRDDRGGPKFLAGLITDMTRQKLAEREILRAKEIAESADRVKSAFLASMSHELRTPLNSIIGFTGILIQELAGPLNAEQKKQLGMVRNSARHLLNLINDVLDISKIEAGQLRLSREAFSLPEAIRSIVQAIGPMAGKKDLELLVDIGPGVGEIVSDRSRVEQVLINLVNNAVKFTDKGRVHLRCVLDEGRIVVSVSDTGIGLRPEDLETLFEPFRQIDMGVSRRYEGTGLGLSICKRLMDLLGGEIRALSEGAGKGSTFIFTLPVR